MICLALVVRDPRRDGNTMAGLPIFLLSLPLIFQISLSSAPALAAEQTAKAVEDSLAQGHVDPAGNLTLPEAAEPHPTAWKELPRHILLDQGFLWLRPFRLKSGDLPWAAAIAGPAAALIATDREVGQELSDSPPGEGVDFSRRVSQIGGGAGNFGVAAGFYLLGRWRDDERARSTGLLGLRALADSLIVVETLKSVFRRPRPTRQRGHVRIDDAEGSFFEGGRSFPSGHAIEAWAMATVVAGQYGHRRWIPPTAYGLAGLVAVARVTERKHFPSDIFIGGVLGYLIGRHVLHEASGGPGSQPRRWNLTPYLSSGAGLTFAWEF